MRAEYLFGNLQKVPMRLSSTDFKKSSSAIPATYGMSPKQDPGQKNNESEFMEKCVYTDNKNTDNFSTWRDRGIFFLADLN
jgi:hypothetical protein